MATVNRNITFGAAENLTNTKLHNLIDLASVTDIVQADMQAGFITSIRSTTPPASPQSGQLWADSSPGTGEGIALRQYDNVQDQWEYPGNGFFADVVGTIAVGDIVVLDLDLTGATNARNVETTTTRADRNAIGVARKTGTAEAGGVLVQTRGIVQIRITGTVTKGQYVISSATAGLATTTRFAEPGVIGVWLETTSTSPAWAYVGDVPTRSDTVFLDTTLFLGTFNSTDFTLFTIMSGLTGNPRLALLQVQRACASEAANEVAGAKFRRTGSTANTPDIPELEFVLYANQTNQGGRGQLWVPLATTRAFDYAMTHNAAFSAANNWLALVLLGFSYGDTI